MASYSGEFKLQFLLLLSHFGGFIRMFLALKKKVENKNKSRRFTFNKGIKKSAIIDFYVDTLH